MKTFNGLVYLKSGIAVAVAFRARTVDSAARKAVQRFAGFGEVTSIILSNNPL